MSFSRRLSSTELSQVYNEDSTWASILSEVSEWIRSEYEPLKEVSLLFKGMSGHYELDEETGKPELLAVDLHYHRTGEYFEYFDFTVSKKLIGGVLVINLVGDSPILPLTKLSGFATQSEAEIWFQNNPDFYRWNKFIDKVKGDSK